MIDNRIAYDALLYAMLPAVVVRLLWRSRRERRYLRHWNERFGYFRAARDAPPLIWLHAVSVGETRAAEPLLRALRARYPDHRVLLTHMTPTGRETGVELFGDTVERAYLPYDYPGAVRRFLDAWRPCVGVLMETEIWPNLILANAQRGVPLYLVNARLSEKSYSRYRRFPRLAAAALRGFSGIAAQTEEDARRFVALAAQRVAVTGNLKFDVVPPDALVRLGQDWRSRCGERPVLLAASTRDGEEALVLDAFEAMALHRALLVIVPRHPQRFDDVARLLQQRGLSFQRRSEDVPVRADTRVLLGDSMGEMFAYYAACDVAFIGGSLLPYGAQNLIEACAVGRPVLIGPHTYNFAEATELAIAAGAALRVVDSAALADAARRLLTDREAAVQMAKAALAFSRHHQGATKRVIDMLRFEGA
jgi:3-deoxy-D-manno-octulosonic-acid transferase